MKWIILSLLPPSVFLAAMNFLAAAPDEAPTKVFEPTAWFGLLGPILAAIGIIGVAWGIKQSGALKAWQQTAAAAKERAEIMEKDANFARVRAEEREKARVVAEQRLAEVLEALKLEQSKRDLTPILNQVLQMNSEGAKRFDAAMKGLAEHDRAVTERHAAMQEMLAEITKQLIRLSAANGRGTPGQRS